jgi:hypothetical protein
MGRSDPSRVKACRLNAWPKVLWRHGRGVCLCLLLGAFCAQQPAVAELSCALPAKPMVRFELVFGAGQDAGSGHGVSAAAFMAFLGKEVTPRFPDGLSLFSGYGQWRNGKGRIIKEASRLLLIWYVGDATSNAKIEAIRTAYKKRFHQKSVLRADGISCVSF